MKSMHLNQLCKFSFNSFTELCTTKKNITEKITERNKNEISFGMYLHSHCLKLFNK